MKENNGVDIEAGKNRRSMRSGDSGLHIVEYDVYESAVMDPRNWLVDVEGESPLPGGLELILDGVPAERSEALVAFGRAPSGMFVYMGAYGVLCVESVRERSFEHWGSDEVGLARIHTLGGGVVALSADVGAGVYVSRDSAVCGNAVVSRRACLVQGSFVDGDAVITDRAVISRSRVGDSARVSGKTTVAGSTVTGESIVHGHASVISAVVSGAAEIGSRARLFGGVVTDDVVVGGDAVLVGAYGLKGRANLFERARLVGKVEVSEKAWVYGSGEAFGDVVLTGECRVTGGPALHGGASLAGSRRRDDAGFAAAGDRTDAAAVSGVMGSVADVNMSDSLDGTEEIDGPREGDNLRFADEDAVLDMFGAR